MSISNKHQVPQQLLQQCSAYEQLLLQRYAQQPYVSRQDFDYLIECRRYRGSKDQEFLDIVRIVEPMDLELHKDAIFEHYYREKATTSYPFVGKYNGEEKRCPELYAWYADTTSEYDLDIDEEEAMAVAWKRIEANLDDLQRAQFIQRGRYNPCDSRDPKVIRIAEAAHREDNGTPELYAKNDE